MKVPSVPEVVHLRKRVLDAVGVGVGSQFVQTFVSDLGDFEIFYVRTAERRMVLASKRHGLADHLVAVEHVSGQPGLTHVRHGHGGFREEFPLDMALVPLDMVFELEFAHDVVGHVSSVWFYGDARSPKSICEGPSMPDHPARFPESAREGVGLAIAHLNRYAANVRASGADDPLMSTRLRTSAQADAVEAAVADLKDHL